MSQKTHPIGFRLGSVSQAKGCAGYDRWRDLHGPTSRWSVRGQGRFGDTERYADLTQRDRVLKTVVEELLVEEGYLVNKVIVTRGPNYVGVYADGIRLSEPLLVGGIYGPEGWGVFNSATSSSGSQESVQASRIVEIENLLSATLEKGIPVTIQIHELVPQTSASSEASPSSHNEPVGRQDLRKVINLLYNKTVRTGMTTSKRDSLSRPCCGLLSKVIGYMLSGGRRHREVLRVIMKELTQNFGKLQVQSLTVETATAEGNNEAVSNAASAMNDVSATKIEVTSTEYVQVDSATTGVISLINPSLINPSLINPGVAGFLLILKGRVGGSERSRVLRYRSGPRPRHTVSAGIDHGLFEVNTPSGKMSVTVMAYIK